MTFEQAIVYNLMVSGTCMGGVPVTFYYLGQDGQVEARQHSAEDILKSWELSQE